MAVTNTRPKLNLKYAYERVKSALEGLISDVDKLDPIAKNSAGNGIYNGKMTISQRGDYTSATAVTTATYYLDRWRAVVAVITASLTHISDGYATGVNTSKYEATSTGTGSIGADQLVEGVEKYKGQQVTVSALVKSNTPNARISLYADSVIGGSAHSGSGEFEVLSVTANVPSSVVDLRPLLRITASNGTSSVSITSGDYIEFTDVRLDLGEHRLSGDREYGEEEKLCKRYFRKQDFYVPATTAQTLGIIDMRSVPTITGGGAGFTSTGTTADTLIAYQTTGAAQTLSLSAEL